MADYLKSPFRYYLFVTLLVMALLFGSISAKIESGNKALRAEIEQLKIEKVKSEPEVIQGDYTLFLYYPDGHTGYVYVTQYYLEDGLLHYTPTDRPEEVTAVPFTRATGHITGEKLWDYGYLEIPVSELFGGQ